MLRLRGIGPVLALVLGVAARTFSPAATFTHTPQTADTTLERLVTLSVTEYGSTISGVAATTKEGGSLQTRLLASMIGDDSGKEPDDMNSVVRHRGFTKALLIIVISGAFVRFLTSRTFFKLISEAFDPQAW